MSRKVVIIPTYNEKENIEKIIRKKLNPKYEGYIHGIGMVLLLALMAIIMFKDIFVTLNI
jgi:membrane-associated protease RseP (regulator of RpoE activity)